MIGQIPLDTSAIAIWGLDGDFTDRSGNGKTLTGTATYDFLNNFGGFGGQVCDFTGGYATTSGLSNFGATDPYTVGCWIYFDVLPGSGTFFNFISRQDGSTRNYELSIYNNAGTTKVFFSNGVGGADLNGSQTISAGQWYFIVATHSSADSGTNKIYINGVLDNSKTSTGNTGQPTSNTRIATAAGGGSALNGKMDEVFIYSRELSATEIKDKYWEGINYGKYN